MDLKRFQTITQLDGRTLKIFFSYNIAIGILSLIIPVSAQTLVHVVTFASISQPLIMLMIAIFILLASVSFLRICQIALVERIQQRMFAFSATAIALLIPNLKYERTIEHQGAELVNRFFETMTIQKAAFNLLIYGASVLFQTIFGMILLAFYHPIFLVFDIIIAVGLSLAIFLPAKKAIRTAIQECHEKHKVAAWLEDVINNIFLFKSKRHSNYALDKVDEKIAAYLQVRKQHFSCILGHAFSIYGLACVAITALLSIGGYLVIRDQLTLGQLVAAEIVLTTMVAGFIILASQLDDFYDLLASCHKLDSLLSLETEDSATDDALSLENKSIFTNGIELELHEVLLPLDKDSMPVINENIPVGDKIALNSRDPERKAQFFYTLFGIMEPRQGFVKANHIKLNRDALFSYRDEILLLREEEVFAGSILENLTLNNDNIKLEDVHKVLQDFSIEEQILELPNSVTTELIEADCFKSHGSLRRLLMARAVLCQPKLLMIDGWLDNLSLKEAEAISIVLFNDLPDTTIIVATRREDITGLFARRIQL